MNRALEWLDSPWKISVLLLCVSYLPILILSLLAPTTDEAASLGLGYAIWITIPCSLLLIPVTLYALWQTVARRIFRRKDSDKTITSLFS
jgi:hypothetical protein